jgi:hypothetical protein
MRDAMFHRTSSKELPDVGDDLIDWLQPGITNYCIRVIMPKFNDIMGDSLFLDWTEFIQQ